MHSGVENESTSCFAVNKAVPADADAPDGTEENERVPCGCLYD